MAMLTHLKGNPLWSVGTGSVQRVGMARQRQEQRTLEQCQEGAQGGAHLKPSAVAARGFFLPKVKDGQQRGPQRRP